MGNVPKQFDDVKYLNLSPGSAASGRRAGKQRALRIRTEDEFFKDRPADKISDAVRGGGLCFPQNRNESQNNRKTQNTNSASKMP